MACQGIFDRLWVRVAEVFGQINVNVKPRHRNHFRLRGLFARILSVILIDMEIEIPLKEVFANPFRRAFVLFA